MQASSEMELALLSLMKATGHQFGLSDPAARWREVNGLAQDGHDSIPEVKRSNQKISSRA